MNLDQFEGKWQQLKGKVKENWGRLTTDSKKVFTGKRDQLAGKIQEKFGTEPKQAKREADSFLRRWGHPPSDA